MLIVVSLLDIADRDVFARIVMLLRRLSWGEVAYLLFSFFVVAAPLCGIREVETIAVGKTVWNSLVGAGGETVTCMSATAYRMAAN